MAGIHNSSGCPQLSLSTENYYNYCPPSLSTATYYKSSGCPPPPLSLSMAVYHNSLQHYHNSSRCSHSLSAWPPTPTLLRMLPLSLSMAVYHNSSGCPPHSLSTAAYYKINMSKGGISKLKKLCCNPPQSPLPPNVIKGWSPLYPLY